MCDFSSVLGEPESGPFESYNLIWYDETYDDGSLYKEPLSSNQDIFYENSFWGKGVAEDDPFSRNTFSGNGVLPYNGWVNNNWLKEFESLFVSPEKSDDTFGGEVMQHGSYYVEDTQPVCTGNPWLLQLDGGHRNDDYNYLVRQELEAASADSWDEMGLVESIFGHWPFLLRLDLEDRSEPTMN